MMEDIQGDSAMNLFPALVWERILDSMGDSKDIENVLRTFPELDVLFHKKKTLWLFDQVLPHVFKKVGHWDRVSFVHLCRQSCKRWCNVTGSFLRDHPSRRPYNQNGINRRTVPYREFSYDDDKDQYERTIHLRTVEAIRDFHTVMTQHSNPDDPLKTFQVWIVQYDSVHPEEYLDTTLAFLKAFGKHILNIILVFNDFEPEDVKTAKNTQRKILECLSCLPNVRRLFINFQFYVALFLDDAYKQRWSYYLGRLQHLETLELNWCCPFRFQRQLMKRFRWEIKKLNISTRYLEYRSLRLNNLFELVISFRDGSSFNGQKIQTTLRKCPLLKKLKLFIDMAIRERRIEMTVSGLYQMLQHTQLEELDLECCRIRKNCACFYKLFKIDKFPSVKYVTLIDYRNQDLDFLSAFPSLEHLHIEQAEDPTFFGQQTECTDKKLEPCCNSADKLADTVRAYVYKPVVPATVNIWKKIPSLKLLTITRDESFQVRFARECGNKPLYAFLFGSDDDEGNLESKTGSDDEDSESETSSDDESEGDNDEDEMFENEHHDGKKASDENNR